MYPETSLPPEEGGSLTSCRQPRGLGRWAHNGMWPRNLPHDFHGHWAEHSSAFRQVRLIMTPQPVTWAYLASSPPSPDLEHSDICVLQMRKLRPRELSPDQVSRDTRGLGSAWLHAQASGKAGPLTSSSWETMVPVTSLTGIQRPENLRS